MTRPVPHRSFPALPCFGFVKSFKWGVAVFACLAPAGNLWAAPPSAANDARAARLPEVVVRGTDADAEGPGAYGQPAWIKRSRTSTVTNAYVLSPFTASAGIIWEGIAPRHGKTTHLYNQEFELGLPGRMQIAVENQIEQLGSFAQNKSTSVEFRYALADWNKIPLNPTFFAEWKFGQGRELQEEEEEADREERDLGESGKEEADRGERGERDREGERQGAREPEGEREAKPEESRRESGRKPRTPDSFELRLLLSQEFCENWQWTLNGFFEQEVGRDRERELGFSQSVIYAPPGSSFEVGVEMQFVSKTKRDARSQHENSFVVGPCLGYNFTSRARLELAPLFGIGDESPQVDAFVMFSYQFGGPAEREGRQPISTSNR